MSKLTAKKRYLMCLMPLLALTSFSCSNNSNIDPKLCLNGKEHTFIYHKEVINEETCGNEAYYSCEVCNKIFDLNHEFINEVKETKPARKILLNNKFNNKVINLNDELVNKYLNASEDKVAGYIFNNRSNHNSKAISSISLSWENNGASGINLLEIARDEEFNDILLSKKLSNMYTYSFDNVVPGKYYYRVSDYKDSSISSVTDCFQIEGIRAFTNGTLANFRDIGGWYTSNGDKVKYEKLYRSAALNNSDLPFFNSLGINTQLDLRIHGTGDARVDEINNLVGLGNINLVKANNAGARFWPQYDYIFDSSHKDDTKYYFNNIFDVLSNKESYPIVFNCRSGADRTGTLAYIINGLCGVPYENLVKDYELTTFFYSYRCRDEIILDGDEYRFSGNGDMNLNGEHFCFGKMHNQMMNYSSKNLQEAIFNFLTSYCEVNELKIKSTLENIIEGNSYLSLFND